jgi:F-type H+-transporting ATPase subunit a
MADPVLHIKDSYYFEVPKVLLPARYESKRDFPGVWVKNDDQFQEWEADRLYNRLQEKLGDKVKLPAKDDLLHDWQHWQHEAPNHANFAKPLDQYIESFVSRYRNDYEAKSNALPKDAPKPSYDEYLNEQAATDAEGVALARAVHVLGEQAWDEAKEHAGGKEAVQEFQNDSTHQWSPQKVAAYNKHLSGKILLYPQPFGDLRNLYEPESGFNISRLMLIEVIVGLLLFTIFTWVAKRLRTGAAPKGRFWNLMEVFLLFIRDQIARPAIGAHHDEHEAEHHAHGTPTGVEAGHAIGGAGIGGAPVEVSEMHHGHADNHHHTEKHVKGKQGHAHANPYADADRFVPLLWTIFFFVLFCNLFGLIPWLGGPTATFGVTVGLAMCTFATVVLAGMMKFGFFGFFLNQIPSMDLPLPLAILLKPMIFAIEMLGLLIKHLILSVRLLANMVAGHLVILGIMALAFGPEAAESFQQSDTPGWLWWLVASISVVSAAAFNLLELFVAFLQAYIFTFLSALFIGASVHKH